MAHQELPYGESLTVHGITISNDTPGYIGLSFDADGEWQTIVIRRQRVDAEVFIGSLYEGVKVMPPEPDSRGVLTPWEEGYTMGYAEGHRFGRQEASR